MLYLNGKDIREIFSMREAIESDREAFYDSGGGAGGGSRADEF